MSRVHNALRRLEHTGALRLAGAGVDSEHWLLAFMEGLLAQFRGSGEINFEDVQRLLQQHEQAFLRDLETAKRMYRTYPRLFQEDSSDHSGESNCILCAAMPAAIDVTGTWRGTITTEMARETTNGRIPAYMALEQTDGKITGSAGGDENILFRIREGRIDGDQLTVEASPREGSVLQFNLTLKGDMLEGEVEENRRNIGTATLKRER